jgi:hypothetical protein
MNYLILAGAVLLVVGYGGFLIIQGLLKGFGVVSKTLADQQHAMLRAR